MTSAKSPERLTPDEAMRFLGVTRNTLRRLRQQREVIFFRTGHRSVSYDRASLQSYLDRVRVDAVN